MSDRNIRQARSVSQKFQTREDEAGGRYISGYFSVFNSIYELWDGATESVAPGAFDETLGGDIRCLTDHDSRLVLGRTTAGTLRLQVDEKGLWGEVQINDADQDAVNLYERVKRGDVNQCSFGFDILEEDRTEEDGIVHWTIKRVKLYEVSVVTFPAYEETGVTARKAEFEQIKKRKLQERKAALQKRIERS